MLFEGKQEGGSVGWIIVSVLLSREGKPHNCVFFSTHRLTCYQ